MLSNAGNFSMFIQRKYKNINETKVNKRQGGTNMFMVVVLRRHRYWVFVLFILGVFIILLVIASSLSIRAASMTRPRDQARGLETWCRTQECIQEMLKWEMQMSTQNIGNIFGKFGGR